MTSADLVEVLKDAAEEIIVVVEYCEECGVWHNPCKPCPKPS